MRTASHAAEHTSDCKCPDFKEIARPEHFAAVGITGVAPRENSGTMLCCIVLCCVVCKCNALSLLAFSPCDVGIRRLRKAYIRDSLELHSIDASFKRSVLAVSAWRRAVTRTLRQSRRGASGGSWWRLARLDRVFALLRSRCDQGEVASAACVRGRGRGRALWRSGLGTVDSSAAGAEWERKTPCILFYSQINRSHRAVSSNYWETRRLTASFGALRLHSERGEHRSCQAYRAIWFWKYWREVMALKR